MNQGDADYLQTTNYTFRAMGSAGNYRVQYSAGKVLKCTGPGLLRRTPADIRFVRTSSQTSAIRTILGKSSAVSTTSPTIIGSSVLTG